MPFVYVRRTFTEPAFYGLAQLCNGIEEFFCFLPSKAGVCDGFSINMIRTDFLATGYQIAFKHDTFHQMADITGYQAAVQHFFYNADLLFVFLAGVGMVGINNDSRIF